PSGWYQTDEENINNVWNEVAFPIYLIGTQKIDGTSISISTEYIATRKNVMERFVKKGDTEVESTETYIKYGSQYQDILRAAQETEIVLRGELNGQGVGSSGNKLNPALKEAANIRFFGIDRLRGGITYKLPYAEFVAKAQALGIQTVPIIFEKEFSSRGELLATCEAYFAQHVIEGIVVRTPDSKFSAKIMNNYYDSKK
ncbi:MAG: RNA ligase family protein, partial [Capnocytophaga granulosa]